VEADAVNSASDLRRLLFLIALLLAIVATAILVGVTFGASGAGLRTLFGSDPTARRIVMGIRLPRVLLAALEGAALAVAGLTFQTLLRNPLADPFILGVSGGAASGAAVGIALGIARRYPAAIPLLSFAGACGATAAVFLLARRRRGVDPVRLILSGLVLNSFFSAIILVSLSLSPNSDLTVAFRWMIGNLAGASWNDVIVLAVSLAVALVVLVWIANDLRLFSFGEEDASGRGVAVERVKLAGYATASLLTGAAVAVSGIIGFVGLLVPHLVRMAWRRDYRHLLPLSALAGAALVVTSDVVSRTIAPPLELPIGALTAFLGVPFFLLLLRREI
jgi:iron complex transport system permease protein